MIRVAVGEWVESVARRASQEQVAVKGADGMAFVVWFYLFVSCGKEQDNGTGVWSSLLRYYKLKAAYSRSSSTFYLVQSTAFNSGYPVQQML